MVADHTEWEPSMIETPICGYDVGDPPDSCRCLLPRGHDGLHECKHNHPNRSEA